MKKYFLNLINFLIKSEKKIVLFLGILTIALVSFTFGIMKGKKFNYQPIIISLPENPPVIINSNDSEKNTEKELLNSDSIKCVYVGSKNGSKYYPPTCEYAKKIKTENLRCFSSDEDAINKGYTKTTSCD